VEHRRRLEDDRTRDHEAERGDVKTASTRPELAHQHQEQDHRPRRGERVDDLPDALRVLETEILAEEDARPADSEESGRRVGAGRFVGQIAVPDEAVGVVQRLPGVVAGDRGIDDRVANRDDGDEGHNRSDGDRVPRTGRGDALHASQG
jgi:hypothetical protein